ncbi:phosphatidate cytidylyltransferase [Pantoea sp. Aalb]|uniref:phosphatidate cytidylyltransferase n=1 Tax=Pantoea sp. Aalb TaxID=2576762 RepID=UPI00132C28CC|nr:phosphatidate cytidylyltransferase [Pantoea sp. Aalb]MXP67221.1 phosphatidate cytidylyltransferase [Pantoea sp. Aalb]
MQNRLITSLILIFSIIILLFFISLSSFAIITIIICMFATYEWGQLAGIKMHKQRILLTTMHGSLLYLLLIFLLQPNQYNLYQFQIKSIFFASLGWWFIALILMIFYPSSATMWRSSRFLRLLFGMFTLIPFFVGIIELRQYKYNIDSSLGAWWLLFVMLIVWSIDTGSYVFGKFFGKYKLAVKISPNKTWEGVFGGVICSLIVSWLFAVLSPLHMKPSILTMYTLIIMIAAVIGDLTESMFKREVGIKDSSKLIPGHGGILDRIDSLTAAIPLFICLIIILNII